MSRRRSPYRRDFSSRVIPTGWSPPILAHDFQQGAEGEVSETFDRREVMSLIRGFYGIKDKQIQADILRLISKLGHRESRQCNLAAADAAPEKETR